VLHQQARENQLVGIARMAAESDLLEAKRNVEYRDLETRRLIGRTSNPRMPFRWTINPYRGCEFGCKYCYARYTHEFMELHESRDFEEKIFAKQWNPSSLRDELRKIPRKEAIAIGTATDPYQPAERRYGVTRRILEILADEKGRHLSLVTKSDLVRRDTDLLGIIGRRNVLHVAMTITTTDEELARKTERYAPRPSLRLASVAALVESGIAVTVLANPVMPYLTDSEENLDTLGRAVAATGARGLGGRVLFLKPCAQRAFFPFLEEHFPELVPRYRALYAAGAYLRGRYVDDVARRVESVQQRYGLTETWSGYKPEEWEDEPQLSLFE
jgi:DNA repair photolyase